MVCDIFSRLIVVLWLTCYFVLSGEKEYYERQFTTLKSFEEVDHVVQSGSPEEDDDEQAQHERAMRISNYANIVLLVFKVLQYCLN